MGAHFVGHGVDAASTTRIGAWAERYDDGVLEVVFTPGELARARGSRRRDVHLSVCFAAKEAVGKALGCGLSGIELVDVEATVGRPGITVQLHGSARKRASELGSQGVSAAWARLPPDLVLVWVVLY